MANKARIPKFGDWKSGGNQPYTKYFDNARKGKTGGKLINPNDPQENPDSFAEEEEDTRALPSPLRTSFKPDAARPKNGNVYRPTGSKASADSPRSERARRNSSGSDRSFEKSPLRSTYQPKGGVNSPSWERKGASEGHRFAPNTPGRARGSLGGQGGERVKTLSSSGKRSAVPKFGEWDESDPASADGFTHIFNQVRVERHDASATLPSASIKSSYPKAQKHNSYYDESKGCGCFSWLK